MPSAAEPGRPLKILVADDDPDLLALIGFTLTQAGFEICTASNGSTALQAFADEQPDCVLLDINMPGHNGLEQDPATAQILQTTPGAGYKLVVEYRKLNRA